MPYVRLKHSITYVYVHESLFCHQTFGNLACVQTVAVWHRLFEHYSLQQHSGVDKQHLFTLLGVQAVGILFPLTNAELLASIWLDLVYLRYK